MTLSLKQKNLLKEFCSFRCEICRMRENELNRLVIHHIHRRVWDGSDQLRNLTCICEKCHKLLHQGEFNG